MYINNIYTIIPYPLFDNNESKTYLNFNSLINESYKILYNSLKSTEDINIYAIPDEIFKYFSSKYPEIKFYHHITPMLNELLIVNKSYPEQQFYINFNENIIDIIIIDKSSLIFCNSFNINSENDVLYFTLSVMNQFKLPQDSTKITLIGKINNQSKSYLTLKNYIKKLHIIKPNESFNYSSAIPDFSLHYYYNLFNLYLCA